MRGPQGLGIPNGHRTSSFGLPDSAGIGGPGFFDGLDVGTFAPLMVAKHRASVSRVTQEQMALASLMDSATSDLFLQCSMPNSQMALCLQASMDALVASSSSRALLAFSWSSAIYMGGVMLLDLVITAMGEMVVGTPSRDASAISASSEVLTWDEVSTG